MSSAPEPDWEQISNLVFVLRDEGFFFPDMFDADDPALAAGAVWAAPVKASWWRRLLGRSR